MFVKGWLIECDNTGLTALSVIIHKATHGDIQATSRDNLLMHMRKERRGHMHMYLAANQRLRFFRYIENYSTTKIRNF